MPDFIKGNMKVAILAAFVALALMEIILPWFYDLVTSAIELVGLYFLLYHAGLFK